MSCVNLVGRLVQVLGAADVWTGVGGRESRFIGNDEFIGNVTVGGVLIGIGIVLETHVNGSRRVVMHRVDRVLFSDGGHGWVFGNFIVGKGIA